MDQFQIFQIWINSKVPVAIRGEILPNGVNSWKNSWWNPCINNSRYFWRTSGRILSAITRTFWNFWRNHWRNPWKKSLEEGLKQNPFRNFCINFSIYPVENSVEIAGWCFKNSGILKNSLLKSQEVFLKTKSFSKSYQELLEQF